MFANVLAVCYVCVPRPQGGDGVVFAGWAHIKMIFGLQIYLAIIVRQVIRIFPLRI